MLKTNDIVRSKKQNNIVIPYQIKEIVGGNAKCVNLIDTYDYTIPLDDLYLWIVDIEMSIKQNEFIKLNEKPLEGFREVKWSVNDEYEHHTLTIKDGYGKSVTLFNEEIEKLYEVLSNIIFNKK